MKDLQFQPELKEKIEDGSVDDQEIERLEREVTLMSENGDVAKEARLQALRWVVDGYE